MDKLNIDNCKNNGINDDGMYVRLAYPTADNMPTPAPAFIVIGGATLSRGLTIEGWNQAVWVNTISDLLSNPQKLDKLKHPDVSEYNWKNIIFRVKQYINNVSL